MARPPFKPTPTHRRKVANAAGGGMSHDAIAAALGISVPTLTKYFEHELYAGASSKRLDVLDAMQRMAVRGNVSAQKAYLATVEPRGIAPPAIEPAKPPKRGKKAQAQADAVGAERGTGWDNLLAFPARGKAPA